MAIILPKWEACSYIMLIINDDKDFIEEVYIRMIITPIE